MTDAHRDCPEPSPPESGKRRPTGGPWIDERDTSDLVPETKRPRPVTLTLTIHAITVGWANVGLRNIGQLAQHGSLEGPCTVTHAAYDAHVTVDEASP